MATLAGHTFKEWNTQEDGKGISFDPKEALITENMTVYAIYDVNEVAVTFIDSKNMTVVTTLYNTKLDQTKVPMATLAGHTFKEWNTQEDGKGTSFDPKEAVIIENMTVYAIYTKDTVKPVDPVKPTEPTVPTTGVDNNQFSILAGGLLLFSGILTLLRKREDRKES
jgi:LPXTG-motif cell wall-anchored protein